MSHLAKRKMETRGTLNWAVQTPGATCGQSDGLRDVPSFLLRAPCARLALTQPRLFATGNLLLDDMVFKRLGHVYAANTSVVGKKYSDMGASDARGACTCGGGRALPPHVFIETRGCLLSLPCC